MLTRRTQKNTTAATLDGMQHPQGEKDGFSSARSCLSYGEQNSCVADGVGGGGCRPTVATDVTRLPLICINRHA